MKDALIIGLVVLVMILATAGAVLLLHFWVRWLHRSARVVLAALIGATILVLPVWADSAEFIVYLAVLAGAGVISFPTAYLATRKLERDLDTVSSVFE